MTRKVYVPSVFQSGFNQFIEVDNLEAPCVVEVDDFVDRVQRVHVRGQKMMRSFVPKNTKAIVDGHVVAKWFNVDSKYDWTNATRGRRAPN